MPSGYPVINPRRCWSDKDLDDLYELSDEFSLPEIAKKLNRTEDSVKRKLVKLKISRRTRSGWFTEEEVCNILGCDHRWVQSRGLLMSPSNPDKPPRKGKSCPWKITEKDLKKFIQEHPEDLIGRKIDIVMIIDILAGIRTKL